LGSGLRSAENPSKEIFLLRKVIAFLDKRSKRRNYIQLIVNNLREVGAIDLADGHLLFEAGVKKKILSEAQPSLFSLASEN
jgi:hypothetical protein